MDVFFSTQSIGLLNINIWLSLEKILYLFFLPNQHIIGTGPEEQNILYLIAGARTILFMATVSLFSIWLNQKIQIIHEGRTRVYMNGHTLILGWSEQIFSILNELIKANSNQSRSSIVILAPVDPRIIKREIFYKVRNTGKTRIIIRQGEHTDFESLALVSINTSKSIIILNNDDEQSDRHVLDTIKALVHFPDRRAEPFHIVAALRDHKNLSLAKFFGKDEVELIAVDKLSACLFAQVSYQPVIHDIYEDLMDFNGQEIYFTKQAELIGKTYQEALFHYENNVLIGLYSTKDGGIVNPPMDRIITAADFLALLAEDDDKIVFNKQIPELGAISKVRQPRSLSTSRNLIILGWNRQILLILDELNKYFTAGSTILFIEEEPALEKLINSYSHRWKNIHFSFLEQLNTPSDSEMINLKLFNTVILLVENGNSISQVNDLKAVKSLKWLCKLAAKEQTELTVVHSITELLNLIDISDDLVDNIMLNPNLVSLLLCQVSENKGVNSILTDLFTPEGSEIYVKPITNYISPESPTDFYTILGIASIMGETAIGYIKSDLIHSREICNGLRLNPRKSEVIAWKVDDKIITLANF